MNISEKQFSVLAREFADASLLEVEVAVPEPEEVNFARETRRSNLRRIPSPKGDWARERWIPIIYSTAVGGSQ